MNLDASPNKVYKITNTSNGKVYIGATIRDVNLRFKDHYKNKKRSAIHYAMKKHGLENFIIEVIEFCETQKQMFDRESYWIKHYRETLGKKNVYNISDGKTEKQELEFFKDRQRVIQEKLFVAKTIIENPNLTLIEIQKRFNFTRNYIECVNKGDFEKSYLVGCEFPLRKNNSKKKEERIVGAINFILKNPQKRILELSKELGLRTTQVKNLIAGKNLSAHIQKKYSFPLKFPFYEKDYQALEISQEQKVKMMIADGFSFRKIEKVIGVKRQKVSKIANAYLHNSEKVIGGQYLEIARILVKHPEKTQSEISKMFNTVESTVSMVNRGRFPGAKNTCFCFPIRKAFRIGEKEKLEVVALSRQGLSPTKISEKLKISKTSVCRILKSAKSK